MRRKILEYLAEHPDAKDTLDGVIQWWLPQTPRRLGPSEVQRALDTLEQQDWITAKRGPTTILYGVNALRLDEIRKFLNT